jgi:hypothetical protein
MEGLNVETNLTKWHRSNESSITIPLVFFFARIPMADNLMCTVLGLWCEPKKDSPAKQQHEAEKPNHSRPQAEGFGEWLVRTGKEQLRPPTLPSLSEVKHTAAVLGTLGLYTAYEHDQWNKKIKVAMEQEAAEQIKQAADFK